MVPCQRSRGTGRYVRMEIRGQFGLLPGSYLGTGFGRSYGSVSRWRPSGLRHWYVEK